MSDSKFTIHDWHTGPYPARVRIALIEKNLQDHAKFVSVDLWKGEHKTADFLKRKNISGTVPVLELEDGTFIAESTAITQFIDYFDGKPTLTGTTPKEQGVIQMQSKRIELEVLDPISVYFHHATPGLGPDVEVYQNPELGLRQRDRAVRGLHYFDSVLQNSTYVVGDTFSMADITLIGALLFAGLVQVAVPVECVALNGWWARMQQRESFQNRIKITHPDYI